MSKNESLSARFSGKMIRDLRSELAALKRKTIALSREKEYFKEIFDNAQDGLIIHDEQGHILEVNKIYCQRLGYSKSEMLKMSLRDLVPEKFAKQIDKRTRLLMKNGTAIFESQDRRKDGTIIPVEVNATYVDFIGRKVIQSVVRDIQERKIAEELIEATMRDNASLIAENKRRAAFTSNVMMRMLEALAEESKQAARVKLLNSSIERYKIRLAVIVFIQNMFSHGPENVTIDIDKLLRRLVPFIFSQFRIHPSRVLTYIDSAVVSMPRERAAHCCQLIAELFTNALQHAFPKGRPGEVLVQLRREPKGGYVLSVADTGIGVPKSFRLRDCSTLGMALILDLVAQLEGSIQLYRRKGTRIVVRFK